MIICDSAAYKTYGFYDNFDCYENSKDKDIIFGPGKTLIYHHPASILDFAVESRLIFQNLFILSSCSAAMLLLMLGYLN